MLSLETLRAAPKVLLHDHLDGGLRPATIVELARELHYGGLPTTDPGELARWFHASAASGSLSLYLRGFAHTIAVMQSADAIERVAYECGEDLARDGIVYAEVRYAPVFSTQRGLNLEQVVTAVVRGFERAEARYPITIHAGEAFGPPSIWQALQYCGAHRIGHGVRLIEDMAIADNAVVKLGPLAAYIRDKRIPLELCPSSNVDTGAVPSLDEHPIRHFIEQRFRVTVNTDNRLMSDVTLSEEFRRLSRALALTLDDVEKLTLNAMKSAFVGYDERVAIIYARIKPGYARLRGEPALAGYPLPPTA